MRYLDELQSKYGFSDGDNVPEGIELYRSVYVRGINAIAEKLNSEYRAVSFDRPGVHNWCLIVFLPKSSLDEIGITGDKLHKADEEEMMKINELLGQRQGYDPAMQEAIDIAQYCELDIYLDVSISINPYVEEVFKDLLNGEVPENYSGEENPFAVSPDAPAAE